MRLSVVIPVLNEEDNIRVLLAALRDQTSPANEIIVVDNGSTDRSVEVARSFGSTIVEEERRGIPAASSAGYDHASGDIIVRCDADCRPGRSWLEQISEQFAKDQSVDALTGPGFLYDLPRGTRWLGSVIYGLGYFGLLGSALAAIPLWGSNMAFRQEAWALLRQQAEKESSLIHDDLDLSCLAFGVLKTKFVPGLRMDAAGRIFARPQGFKTSSGMAMNTLNIHGGVAGIGQRWHSVLRRTHNCSSPQKEKGPTPRS